MLGFMPLSILKKLKHLHLLLGTCPTQTIQMRWKETTGLVFSEYPCIFREMDLCLPMKSQQTEKILQNVGTPSKCSYETVFTLPFWGNIHPRLPTSFLKMCLQKRNYWVDGGCKSHKPEVKRKELGENRTSPVAGRSFSCKIGWWMPFEKRERKNYIILNPLSN